MVIAVYLFLLLYLICCRPSFCDGIRDGSYLSRERTCTINAFMIVSVFFKHAVGLISVSGEQIMPLQGAELFFSLVLGKMGQMVVSTFLLFSGYGIMESMRQKGQAYLSGFWRHRFFKVFYQFELGILIYFLVALSQGEVFTLPQCLIGLTGWTALGGNPTWYIVVTLLMYVIVYVGLRCSGPWRWAVIVGASVLMYGTLASFKGEASYWYNTLFCFPAGMLLSARRQQLESIIDRCRIPAPLLGIMLVGIAYIPSGGLFEHPLSHNLESIIFAYGIALLFSCVRFERCPRLMLWLGGSALFCLYFYHQLIFKLVKLYGPEVMSAECFLAMVLPLCLLLSWLVLQLYAWLDKKVFRV